MIWIISFAVALGFKIYDLKYAEQLPINYEIVFLLVFAPSVIVTIVIILKKSLKN